MTSWTCLFRGTTTAAAEDDGTPEDSSRCLSRCCEGGAIVCPRPLSSPALTNGENAGPQLETASLSLSVPEEEEEKKKRLFSRDQSLERVVDKVVDTVVSSSSFSRSDFDARVNVRDSLFLFVFFLGKEKLLRFLCFFLVFLLEKI